MRKVNQLTPLKIAQLNKVGRYADGLGLYLEVTKRGNKSWAFRYMIDGRARQQGLGPLHTVSLQEARERARQARQVILDGHDPIETRRDFEAARRAEAKRNITFGHALTEFLNSERIAAFGSDKHRKQWRSTLGSVLPVLGNMPLRSITSADVLRAIKPIWEKTPETASRVRGRIERLFDWAKPIHYFDGDNPAQWDLIKDHLKARPKAEHYKALPYAEIPAFMAKLAARNSLAAQCLEFTILTAVRTQEAIGATWSEIDLDSATWTVPAARMKMKRDHRVALSKVAVAVLKALPRNGERVFKLSNRSMLRQLGDLEGNGYTVHGFRSAFSDWARDKTNHPRDLVELALAHAIKDKTEAAYRRGDALDKRRKLMADWSSYATGNNK